MSVHPYAIVVNVMKYEYIHSYKLGARLGSKNKLREKWKKTSHLPKRRIE